MLEINGATELTERENEILELMASGLSNKQIAGQLCLSIRTVKFHTGHIYEKLRVTSRAETIAWFWKESANQNSGK